MRCNPGVLLAAILAISTALKAEAQTLSTLFTNGPTTNRINIVVLSEGFQTSELPNFLVDATNTVKYLLSSPPFAEYSNYFNAYAISVASAQSGSDHHTPSTVLVDTYFNSSFDCFGLQRYVTIPPNNWDTNFADGQGKVEALLQQFMPEYDLVIMIVNDPQYGGAGGPLTITTVNSSMTEVAVHESGHTFGGLTDEYTTPFPSRVPVEYPNATALTNLAAIKWAPWVTTNIPLPTPDSVTSGIGLFLGAEYQTSGWYRPSPSCKMRQLGTPFCSVCTEQLVKNINHAVSSIDAYAPAITNFSTATTNVVPFSVTSLQPATHNLNVQWLVNGAVVTAATNSTFSVLPQSLAPGANTVQALITDTTPLVRNDPAKVMSRSVTWTLNAQLGQAIFQNQLILQNMTRPQNGQFAFDVVGQATNGFVIETSTNLRDWSPVYTNPLPCSRMTCTNACSSKAGGQFFRVRMGR